MPEGVVLQDIWWAAWIYEIYGVQSGCIMPKNKRVDFYLEKDLKCQS